MTDTRDRYSAIRRRLTGSGPRGWWRSFDELADTQEFRNFLEAEFPALAPLATAIDRRHALKLMAGAMVMMTAACTQPEEDIVPYVRMPERVVPGRQLYFATALQLSDFAQPVLVETHEGRPTKIEGNPDHPASRGATDAFMQAALMGLYDPDRTQPYTANGNIVTWDDFLKALAPRLDIFKASGGRGLRVLTGNVTSPTFLYQLGRLLSMYPNARWHSWDPLRPDAVRDGAHQAFGRDLTPRYHFDKVEAVLSLDADFLGAGPDQVAHAADFYQKRRARRGTTDLARLYIVEPSLSITGAVAEHRRAVRRSAVPAVAWAFARALGLEQGTAGTGQDFPPDMVEFIEIAAADLTAHKGAALVVPGDGQPAEVHALAHWMNDRLGAFGKTVDLIEPPDRAAREHADSIEALTEDLNAGRVDTLAIIGGNPAYDAPADLRFGEAIRRASLSVKLGLIGNETTTFCHWHIPELHNLEDWSDYRAPDGTISIAQPIILPLFTGRSRYAILAALMGEIARSSHEVVKGFWKLSYKGDTFDDWWRKVLHDGLIPGTANEPVRDHGKPKPPANPATLPASAEVTFMRSSALWDGVFANNAWLQEMPHPLTKDVWGNPALMEISDAAELGIDDGDIVQISANGRKIEIPVRVAPGQAKGSIALDLGYGRTSAGAIGTGIGVDVYPLRNRKTSWVLTGIDVVTTGRRIDLTSTQHHHTVEGRNIVRSMTLDEFKKLPPFKEEPEPAQLFPDWKYDSYKWAMVVDETACIGCNACVIACQAENNVPVVGPEEVARGREMHWLRVDSYFGGGPESPEVVFQPVPCMQCEKAPCEPVCPVEASVHDSEGLNVQVYNRCIGTRFCQSNCPYKVRRFNFFGYANGQEYANLGTTVHHALYNPDVSVRARGVMEKCTYCVQRISRARRHAEEENRRIQDGEVVTACQAACPTTAIFFGDLNDPSAKVLDIKHQPQEYAMLGELGTRPRTTYLAKVREPHPDLSQSRRPRSNREEDE